MPIKNNLSPFFRLLTLALTTMSLATACTGDADEPFDPDKQDGYTFERTLAPLPVELDSTPHTANLDSDDYIAYEFTLGNPAIVAISSSYIRGSGEGLYKDIDFVGAWNAINNSLDHALFIHNGADGNAGWDLIKRDYNRSSVPSLDSGRYMVMILASPQAYEDMYTVYTEINHIADRPEIGTGSITMQVVRTNQNNDVLGYAEGIRVGLGSESSNTGEAGVVTLPSVRRGEYEVKLGPNGLGRLQAADPNYNIWVAGGGQKQHRIFSITEDQYLDWKEQ